MTGAAELQRLRRASVRAGLVSLVGALIVFAGLGYGGWRLLGLQAEVTTIKDEIAALTPVRDELRAANDALARDNRALAAAREALAVDKETLEESRTKLQVEIESLRSERDRLREGFQRVTALAASPSASNQALQRELTTAAPLSVVVTTRASREPIDARLARYAVWLEMPPEVGPRIERVSYLFNHDSFRNKHPAASDPATGFRVEYSGWGCLDSVVATISLKDGDRQKIVFDMCAVLARAGQDAEPEATVVEQRTPGRAAPAPIFAVPEAEPAGIEPAIELQRTPPSLPTKVPTNLPPDLPPDLPPNLPPNLPPKVPTKRPQRPGEPGGAASKAPGR